ncbi:hypothetical protein D3C76_841510 [compost metagenome]
MRVAQQFLATVAQAHVDTRVGRGIEIALEQGRRLDHRWQQFGDHPMLKARIAGQGARGDARAETDHQRRAWFAVVDHQRQQCLNAHVAQRRHGIAGIGYALDVQALERPLALALGNHGNGAAASFLVERQGAVARAG